MSDNKINLKGIETVYGFSKSGKKGLPPVDKWNPPFCGDIDLKILRDGRWMYMGTEIKRPAMVRLFSTILRLDSDGEYYLVTPVEKVRIQVEDTPFLIVSMDKLKKENKTSLIFYTSLQDEIILTKKNPISIEVNDKNEPSPYILVRNNLRGLISRSVYYELIEYAQERTIEDKNFLTIESNNEIFKMFEIK
tara:strand:+ start:1295 stop:1870 length:576 start_codon:yes stop_codon:yes gene_type:complete